MSLKVLICLVIFSLIYLLLKDELITSIVIVNLCIYSHNSIVWSLKKYYGALLLGI
jgi:hypothetical protein